MTIILFLLMISLVVFIHEGGHCIIGKRSGIGVEEFSVGIGPTIFGFKKGGTKYSLKLFPFGGFCRFEGMDGDTTSPTSFLNAPVWARIATVAAGPVMNFVLAFFLSLFVIGSSGVDMPVIADVIPGYPAEEAGLKSGDEIVKINNKNIRIYRDVSLYSMMNEGKSSNVVFRRDGELRQTVLTPRYSEKDNRYLFGFTGPKEYVKVGPVGVIGYSLTEVRYWIEATWKSLGLLFKGKLTLDDVSGPVGVARVVDEIYEESKPSGIYYIWLNMMNLTVLLSANLGVMNLLPVPALDGGRLIFLFYEALTRKKVPQKVEIAVQFAGMCLLMLLMVVVMINDISRFFR
ncbi:MAG: RIP metalloprotease RseP [Lachnospiraceae bacterium]|nr:RIP metalloprotease RseP [Lachnospiraceae bacterium]